MRRKPLLTFARIMAYDILMIYEVEVSEQADSDLRGIFEYIDFELQSPENASGQLDRLEEQILSLDTMGECY